MKNRVKTNGIVCVMRLCGLDVEGEMEGFYRYDVVKQRIRMAPFLEGAGRYDCHIFCWLYNNQIYSMDSIMLTISRILSSIPILGFL